MSISHRPATEHDLPFVKHAWVESFRESDHAGPIPMRIYRRTYYEVISDVLERPGVETVVAYRTDDPGQLVGFICIERDAFDHYTSRCVPAVHFVYVKVGDPTAPLRRFGIARGLFAAVNVDPRSYFIFPFKTPMGADLVRQLGLKGKHNPRFVRYATKPPHPQERQ